MSVANQSAISLWMESAAKKRRGRPPKQVSAGTPGGRLQRLRIDAGLSQEDLADSLGVSRTMISKYEDGSHEMGLDMVTRAGQVFDRPAAFIMFGGEEPAVRRSSRRVGRAVADKRGAKAIPVISFVAAGALADPNIHMPPESETIEISGLEPGDYFGTRVVGESMNRIAPERSLLIVNRADRELIRGRRYIFVHRGQTTFKRFGGYDPVRLDPESLSSDYEPIYPRQDEHWAVIGRVRLVIAEI